jgi:hypothetical protein
MSNFIKNTSSVMTSGGILQPSQEAISYTGYTSGTNPIVFKTLDTTRSNPSKLISGTTSRFTVLQNSQCNISSSVALAGAGSYIRIYHYNSSNVEIKSSYPSQSSSTNNNATSMTTFANVGDYFLVATNGTPSDGAFTYFSITASAIDSISPNFLVNIAPPTAEMDYYLEAAGNAGQAITANVTDIPFIATVQNNLTWDGSGFTAQISGNYEICGSISSTTSVSPNIYFYINTVLIKNVFRFPSQSNGTFSAKLFLTAGQRFSIRADVGFTLVISTSMHWLSITRLNGKLGQTFIGNVQRNQIAYIKDVKASGVNGGTFTSGAWQTRDLNTVSGDSSIVSLAANVFTLQVGEYDIEVEAPAYGVLEHQVGIAVSTSSTPDVVVGGSSYATPTYSVANSSFARTKITVTTTTSYKILHRCSSTYLTNGFGVNLGTFGTSNIYTQVKITKLY